MPVPPRSARRILVVTVTAAMLLASVAPPLVGAGTYQDPEIADDCLDAGIGPLSAIPQVIADVDRAWWVHDPDDATLELHLALCSDLPGDDERRALEQVFWSIRWTDPSDQPWKANLWLDGLGDPGSERLRLCKNGVDVTGREGGLGEVRREDGNTTHWIVEIDNAADTTGFVGTLTDFTVFAGQYDQSTECHQGFTTFHDRAPDAGSGAPFTLSHANLVAAGLQVDPSSPMDGDQTTFTATVDNTGNNRSESARVDFLVDGTVQSSVDLDPLDPGASTTVQSAPWTADAGRYEIRAVVDAGDAVTEDDESDNEAATQLGVASVQGTDLEVFDLERSPATIVEGDATTFTASIRNRGTDATSPSEVRFDLDGSVFETVGIDSLDTYEVVEVTTQTWSATAGNHTLDAVADPSDVIAEANETNNDRSIAFEVFETLPDLTVTMLELVGTPLDGETVSFNATVANVGETDADPFAVDFTVNGSTLGTVSVDGLGAGETVEVSSSEWSAVEGSHEVRAIADPVDAVVERDEDNNTLEESVRIDAPQPQVVVGIPDSGINPYHEIYYRPDRANHPCTYLADFPCDIPKLDLSIREVHEQGLTYDQAVDRDRDLWESIETGDWYWIPYTPFVAVHCGDPGQGFQSPYCILDENGHGTGTTSSVLMEEPDASIAFKEGGPDLVEFELREIPVDIYSVSWGFIAPLPAPSPLCGTPTFDSGLYVQAAGNDPRSTLMTCWAGDPDVISVGGAYAEDNTEEPLAAKQPEIVSYYCRPTADIETITGMRQSYCGTSFAAPTAAGGLAEVVLGIRRATGYVGTTQDGVVDPIAGVTDDDVRAAMNRTASYDPEGEYSNSGLVPVVDAAPWLQWGWGFYDGKVAESTLGHLLGTDPSPPKPLPARVHMETVFTGKETLYG